MKTLFRWLKRVTQLLFLCFLLAGCAGAWLAWVMLSPGPVQEEHAFDVPAGTSGRDLATLCQREGLIRDEWAFHLLLRAARVSQGLKAGHYVCPPLASQVDLLGVLKKGPQQPPGVKVTIPEGKTREEVARILEDEAGIPAAEFLLLTRNPGKVYPEYAWLPLGVSAEGYLFPDTYAVAETATPSEVVRMMLDRFQDVVIPVAGGRGVSNARLRERLTLASLVESEAQVARERARIASVYLNRLAAGMNLQCDATVLYALGRRKAVVTYDDLAVSSPYNTYAHPGLPPGPICNPGLASVRAAVKPSGESYLYYVRNDRKDDGSHIFTRTFAEHEQAIRDYQVRR